MSRWNIVGMVIVRKCLKVHGVPVQVTRNDGLETG